MHKDLEKAAPSNSRAARGYSWEPFKPGNLAAVKHGLYSERTVGPIAEEVAELLLEAAPELAAPRFRFALTSWAHAEARAALIRFHLDRLDVVDEDQPRERWLKELRAEERLAQEMRRELGLSPASYARLEREMGEALKGRADVERLIEEGRKIREGAPGPLGKTFRNGEEVPLGTNDPLGRTEFPSRSNVRNGETRDEVDGE